MVNPEHYSLARLRRGFVNFGVGKVVNGGIGFAILLLVAGSLPTGEYGAYLILISVGQLTSAVSLMGLNAVSTLYVPRYRLQASTARLFCFVGVLFFSRVLLLLLAAGFLLAVGGPITTFFDIPERASSVSLLAVFVVFSGLGGFLRIGVFEPLLLQGYAQSVWFARNLSFICLLVLLLHLVTGTATLDDVLLAEIASAAISLTAGLWCLLSYWRKREADDQMNRKWAGPPIRMMVRTGIYDHISYLMQLTGSPQSLLLVAGRMLGAEVTAGFGFVLTLTQQIRQYLPAEVVAPVIRPKLVSQFVIDRSFRALNERSIMLYKASLFVLGPVLAIFLASGEEVLGVLSAGRYGGEAMVMVALLVTLIPASHNVVLWGVMITIERMDIFARGALTSLLTVPLAVLFIKLGAGSLGLAAAIFLTVVLYNLVIVGGLRFAGYEYKIDLRGVIMIAIAVVTSGALVLLVPVGGSPVIYAGSVVVLACFIFLVVAFVVKPFTNEERGLINRMVRRNVFVW